MHAYMYTYTITYVQVDRPMYVNVTMIIKKEAINLGGRAQRELQVGAGEKKARKKCYIILFQLI